MNNPLIYPTSPKKPIKDTFHGKEIIDQYRWLENSESDQTKNWVEEQTAFSLNILEQIDGQEDLRNRLTSLYHYEQLVGVEERNGQKFCLKKHVDKQQPVLYLLTKDNTESVLVDVNSSDSSGLTSLDYFYPSNDGTFLAYGVSKGGSEWSEISILDIETGNHFPEKIPRARWSSIIWRRDNSGFYYTRFPKVGEVPEGQEVFNSHIRFHTLNTDPDKDVIIFAVPEKPQEYPIPVLAPNEKFMLVVLYRFVSNDLYLVDLEKKDNPATVIIQDSAHFYDPRIHNDQIFIRSDFENSNFSIYKTKQSELSLKNWECIVSPKEDVLQEFQLSKNNIIVSWLSDVRSRLTIHNLDGKLVAKVPFPDKGSIMALGDINLPNLLLSDSFFFSFQSFIHPPRAYEYHILNQDLKVFHQPDLQIDSERIEIKDTWYQSKDGTRVHMFIVHSRDVELSSNNPTILNGYGGFDISMTPSYGPSIISWVENGGVYAIANIRGGGEHGEAWHKAGQLEKKQNVFDDFIYAAKHLIDLKYCDSHSLGISGGSNGGLLVGAVAVQEPSLFAAVYCSVPLLDMLRYHLFSIGKTWTPEYGNPENETDFQWLYAYSPYHNVKVNLDSPAILFKTALNDSRVEPCHALKMTALMQNLPNVQKPILLLVDSGAGHGLGRPLDKLITDSSIYLSFFKWRLS